MLKRIRHILLVCNNYDNFALEEDGRIDEQIASEYLELNLSNPPQITRAATFHEALQLIQNGESFDLVMVMYNANKDEGMAQILMQIKSLIPQSPIILLTPAPLFAHYRRTLTDYYSEQTQTSPIDYCFCWNSSTDLIIAIIKLIEDNLNAEHDILQGGVRAILLVEDSVRYYSTYLPVLYKLILQQNKVAILDALNEQQQLLRKRARPKVLMATCMEEAEQIWQQYGNNIIGVISDIGFVNHRGDSSGIENTEAGIELCKRIRKENPTMPFVLQSSQESMRQVADRLKVGFIAKKSKTLTQELSDYIGREFGFGDFVVTNQKTGEPIARASDLRGLEDIISTISARDFRRLSDNNYLSKWLFARGLFDLGKYVHALTIDEQHDVEEIRACNIAAIHDYRLHQSQGVVAKYIPETWNDTIWFTRVGSSSIGGKARGLAFLNHILNKYNLYNEWDKVRITVPRTMVITTEYFDHFIQDNGLQDVINSELSDEEILQEFVTSGLREELIDALRHFIRASKRPLAIRSSSKLEDSYYQPFAGVYSTYMIPNTDNEDEELRLLKKALKSVYASVYLSSARGYITSTGNMISEEKMAVVIQEICGEEQNGYFFPTLSGVARSINFYPVGKEKAEEGIVKVAYGLGKAVVDGDTVMRFSPLHPKNIIQTSTPELVMRDTQRQMYALDMRPRRFQTSLDDAVNLVKLNIEDCEQFDSLKRVASTYDYANQRIVDSCFQPGPRYITFAPQLKYNTFPLARIIQRLLDIAAQEMNTPVEIEFAANIEQDSAVFNVLQIRPISADSMRAKVDWEQIDENNALLRSNNALGTGQIDDICDIIYLKQSAFDVLKTQDMASTIRDWNSRMRQEGRGYMLIGYGRWGSSIPSLGVPIIWSDISEAKILVECCLPNFRIEPSQGSHFFQNLTSFNVGYVYLDMFAGRDDYYDETLLNALPAVEETEFMRHVRLTKPLTAYIDGFKSHAFITID